MENKQKIAEALQLARGLGAEYADIRLKDIQMEYLGIENGTLKDASTDRSWGYGIRVYVDGSMGFAASNDPDRMNETAKEAYDIALASLTMQSEKIKLSEKAAAQGHYETPVEKDPFAVPLSEKLDMMKSCEHNIYETWKKHEFSVKTTFYTRITLESRKDAVVFADTDGSYIDQNFCQVSAGVVAKVITDSDVQHRIYENVARGGFECIEEMDLVSRSSDLAREAAILIDAPDCPSGEFDIVITPRQLFLQIHESVGIRRS